MISFIGCEECCGYLYELLGDMSNVSDQSSWGYDDGRGLMGNILEVISFVVIGGMWNYSSNCGSRSLNGSNIISLNPTGSCHGWCNIIK